MSIKYAILGILMDAGLFHAEADIRWLTLVDIYELRVQPGADVQNVREAILERMGRERKLFALDAAQFRKVKALCLAFKAKDEKSIRNLLAEEPVWDVSPGSPEGGVYRGLSLDVQVFGSEPLLKSCYEREATVSSGI